MASLVVPGVPAAQGSLRSFVRGGKALTVPDNKEALAGWRGEIRQALLARLNGAAPSRAAVEVTARFVFLRPAGHYRKDGGLRASARPALSIRPDLDKLVRALLDALTGVLVADDAQVTSLVATKGYGRRPCLRLSWRFLEEPS